MTFAPWDALLLDGRSLVAWPLCDPATGPALLWVEAEASGEEAFAAHFVRAWGRLPESARHELLGHWRRPWAGERGGGGIVRGRCPAAMFFDNSDLDVPAGEDSLSHARRLL
jgi:hypothetical protein